MRRSHSRPQNWDRPLNSAILSTWAREPTRVSDKLLFPNGPPAGHAETYPGPFPARPISWSYQKSRRRDLQGRLCQRVGSENASCDIAEATGRTYGEYRTNRAGNKPNRTIRGSFLAYNQPARGQDGEGDAGQVLGGISPEFSDEPGKLSILVFPGI